MFWGSTKRKEKKKSRGRDASSSSSGSKSEDGVFGRRIDRHSREPPAVLAKLVRYLQARALNIGDLFEVKPPQQEVANVRRRIVLDRGGIQLSSYTKDPHVVAELLKQYLAALPEPILSYECYDSFVNVSTLARKSDRLSLLRMLVMALPEGYQSTATLIFGLLHRISYVPPDHPGMRTVSSARLAAIFGPCFLRPAHQLPYMASDGAVVCELVQLLIDNCDEVLVKGSSASSSLTNAAEQEDTVRQCAYRMPIARFNAVAKARLAGKHADVATLPPLFDKQQAPPTPSSSSTCSDRDGSVNDGDDDGDDTESESSLSSSSTSSLSLSPSLALALPAGAAKALSLSSPRSSSSPRDGKKKKKKKKKKEGRSKKKSKRSSTLERKKKASSESLGVELPRARSKSRSGDTSERSRSRTRSRSPSIPAASRIVVKPSGGGDTEEEEETKANENRQGEEQAQVEQENSEHVDNDKEAPPVVVVVVAHPLQADERNDDSSEPEPEPAGVAEFDDDASLELDERVSKAIEWSTGAVLGSKTLVTECTERSKAIFWSRKARDAKKLLEGTIVNQFGVELEQVTSMLAESPRNGAEATLRLQQSSLSPSTSPSSSSSDDAEPSDAFRKLQSIIIDALDELLDLLHFLSLHTLQPDASELHQAKSIRIAILVGKLMANGI
jgi:RhoGAP domain